MQGNVHSIDALRELRSAVLELGRRLSEIGFDLGTESQRALEWVTEEAPAYWRQQRALADQKLREAVDALAAMEATVGGHDKPPTTELKKRVSRLRERLRRCDEKLVQCKRQAVEIARATQTMVTVTGLLQQQAESGLPVAAAKLATWIAALDRYTEAAPSVTPSSDPTTSFDEGTV